jgi:hypothetical protein
MVKPILPVWTDWAHLYSGILKAGKGRRFINCMMHDINYWNDYSIFINRTEELTGMNASRLIEKYEKLIEELENKEDFEWLYEGFEEEKYNSGNQ